MSLQTALAHYGLIHEHTPVVANVTSGRPGRRETALGVYEFRHVKLGWLHGYHQLDVGAGQRAFVSQAGESPARLREANWAQAVADVRPFLEPNVDVSLLAPESLTRVLMGHEG